MRFRPQKYCISMAVLAAILTASCPLLPSSLIHNTSDETTASTVPPAISGLLASDGGPMAVKLTWSALDAAAAKVLVAYVPESGDWTPSDGTEYKTGDIIGDVVILWTGTATTCTTYGYLIGQSVHMHVYAVSSKFEYSPAAAASFVVPEPAPKFAGFDFSLGEGDFWEYNYYYSKYADYGNTNFSWTRNFMVMLGAPSQIGGKTAYPLTLQSIGIRFEPRWKWLALEDSVLYGSLYSTGLPESATWTTILDAKTGYWKGGGFFITRAETDYSKASESIQVINGEVASIVTIGSGSASEADYTYVPGYGYVASGEESHYSTAEYFIRDIGPGGYDESFSLLSFGSGGYQSSETERVSFVASSLKSTTPRDFQATWRYAQSSLGIFNFVKIGLGLAGKKHEESMGGTPIETAFVTTAVKRNELHTLLKSYSAEWVEAVPAAAAALAKQSRDYLPSLELPPLLPPGVPGKTGGSTELISIASDGKNYEIPSTSANFAAMKAAILALVPASP